MSTFVGVTCSGVDCTHTLPIVLDIAEQDSRKLALTSA